VLREGETVINPEKKENIIAAIEALEGFLEGQDWFSGNENVSIADLAILAVFATIYHVGLDIVNYPNLAAWYERCSSLPGYAENEKGAKMFADHLKSKLSEPF
jgi:glutathione S-transferase